METSIIVRDPTRTFLLVPPVLVKRSQSYYRWEKLMEKYKEGIALINKIFIYSFCSLHLIGTIGFLSFISFLLNTPNLGWITGILAPISTLLLLDDLQDLYPIYTLYIKNRKVG